MDCTEYIEAKYEKTAKKIKRRLRERWNNRIVTRGITRWSEERGPFWLITVVELVRQSSHSAESENTVHGDRLLEKRAFELKTQKKPIVLNANKSNLAPAAKSTTAQNRGHLQSDCSITVAFAAGRIVTMQPVDAPSEHVLITSKIPINGDSKTRRQSVVSCDAR